MKAALISLHSISSQRMEESENLYEIGDNFGRPEEEDLYYAPQASDLQNSPSETVLEAEDEYICPTEIAAQSKAKDVYAQSMKQGPSGNEATGFQHHGTVPSVPEDCQPALPRRNQGSSLCAPPVRNRINSMPSAAGAEEDMATGLPPDTRTSAKVNRSRSMRPVSTSSQRMSLPTEHLMPSSKVSRQSSMRKLKGRVGKMFSPRSNSNDD